MNPEGIALVAGTGRRRARTSARSRSCLPSRRRQVRLPASVGVHDRDLTSVRRLKMILAPFGEYEGSVSKLGCRRRRQLDHVRPVRGHRRDSTGCRSRRRSRRTRSSSRRGRTAACTPRRRPAPATVSGVCPVPSAFMIQTWDSSSRRSASNTILVPSGENARHVVVDGRARRGQLRRRRCRSRSSPRSALERRHASDSHREHDPFAVGRVGSARASLSGRRRQLEAVRPIRVDRPDVVVRPGRARVVRPRDAPVGRRGRPRYALVAAIIAITHAQAVTASIRTRLVISSIPLSRHRRRGSAQARARGGGLARAPPGAPARAPAYFFFGLNVTSTVSVAVWARSSVTVAVIVALPFLPAFAAFLSAFLRALRDLQRDRRRHVRERQRGNRRDLELLRLRGDRAADLLRLAGALSA